MAFFELYLREMDDNDHKKTYTNMLFIENNLQSFKGKQLLLLVLWMLKLISKFVAGRP